LKKKVKINYLTKNIERSHSDNIQHAKWLAVNVEGVSTKRYHNSIALLAKLSKCARILLDFIVERMDENNFVNNNNLLKKDLNILLQKIGQPTYGGITVNKAFTELSSMEIVFKDHRRKGTYQVSPYFFFNGSEAKRQKVIRDILERPNKAWVNRYRKMLLEQKE
jgi:hypothetical protein